MIGRAIAVTLLCVAGAGCSTASKEVVADACGPQQLPDGAGGAVEAKRAPAIGSASSDDVGTVVREMSWQLCNARENRWIDDDYYRRELTALREGALSASTGRLKALPKTNSDDLAVCLSAAGDDAAKRAACES